MNIFKKILSSFTSSRQNNDQEESKYLPEKEIPVDEQFTHNFKVNGGKFLYCENEEELEENFISILQENDWFEVEALTFEKDLQHYLIENKLSFKNPSNPMFLLTNCEGLIAQDGSILFSSKQLLHYKANDLPKNIVVIAKASQITRSKSDGLRNIKMRYANEIPTNITTMQHFKDSSTTDDFLQYGIQTKNFYLMLLEDF
ncbi:lactate utilization protein B/C [Flavobacterium sp. xlx-214]|uniref:LUD domain-containing protein n=1 Tax=unclassified Flavobacterium TaxID=196869 RepID=UPI0013D17276|nr:MULTISPECIES: LUD domain-containing protein [unclassified Flavobacterium]MBA5793167.1 lactate utilization protein B/C [Flavobacterium sp. xlx-221]QMI82549.1 lactate utilization protein B/C [Flavobacterium sp. xlx-214]